MSESPSAASSWLLDGCVLKPRVPSGPFGWRVTTRRGPDWLSPGLTRLNRSGRWLQCKTRRLDKSEQVQLTCQFKIPQQLTWKNLQNVSWKLTFELWQAHELASFQFASSGRVQTRRGPLVAPGSRWTARRSGRTTSCLPPPHNWGIQIHLLYWCYQR